MLTVTDSTTSVIDKIKVLASGVFIGGSANGLLQLFDPLVNAASVPVNSAHLLTQAMASFRASNGIVGSGTGNLADNHRSSDFLVAPPHHG